MQVSDQTFDSWVRQYTRLLFGIAYWWTGSRTDAEELSQETFFQAYRSRSTLRDELAVKGWLVGVMRHCHSQMRRKDHAGSNVSLSEMDHDLPGREGLSPDAMALHQLLARLDERHRLPLVLFYFEDLSYREISNALEIPIGTVMSRLARAKAMLHGSLSKQQKLSVMPKRGER
ncbi:MAG: hypothetical protein NVSMB62_26480 [Acidobacteriaceae bacterium]